jgi:hypothetical protein
VREQSIKLLGRRKKRLQCCSFGRCVAAMFRLPLLCSIRSSCCCCSTADALFLRDFCDSAATAAFCCCRCSRHRNSRSAALLFGLLCVASSMPYFRCCSLAAVLLLECSADTCAAAWAVLPSLLCFNTASAALLPRCFRDASAQ